MGLLVLAVFWVGAAFAFFVINAKTALTFIALWLIGFALAMGLHLQPYFFLAFEAVLAVILCIKLKLELS